MAQAQATRPASAFASRIASMNAQSEGGAPESNNTRGKGKSDGPQAQLYLNFGMLVTIDRDGTPTEELITLPYGLPIDTMSPTSYSGSNQDFANRMAAKNIFLQDLLNYGSELEPGEAALLIIDEASGLSVELRRRGEERVSDPDTNPYVRRFTYSKPAA